MGASFSSRPSTSVRTEYYSARCEAIKRRRGVFSDDVAVEIEFSKPHWSEVRRVDVAPRSAEEDELNRENREVLEQLVEEYPSLFRRNLDDYVLGRRIAEGGQAKIYAVRGNPYFLMKVFETGTPLRDLLGSCPLPVLNRNVRQCIRYAGMLKDGRFAFVMQRCWGDLRKLIDQAMCKKNVDGIQVPPFPYKSKDLTVPYKWKDLKVWTFQAVDLMYWIAIHMKDLHGKGISHRDLKASNVLINFFHKDLKASNDLINFFTMSFYPFMKDERGIFLADFECSIGVMGTGFWRAPEILAVLRNQESITNEQWMKADVYSYGMTCFEIVTGRIPFDGELENTQVDRQLVIEGKRPQLPSDLDDSMKELITNCWEPNPSLRPTFLEIVDVVETISSRQCQFRLFGIADELSSQYHLATVEEVNEYPGALMKAMPGWEIANLANGSIERFYYKMETR